MMVSMMPSRVHMRTLPASDEEADNLMGEVVSEFCSHFYILLPIKAGDVILLARTGTDSNTAETKSFLCEVMRGSESIAVGRYVYFSLFGVCTQQQLSLRRFVIQWLH